MPEATTAIEVQAQTKLLDVLRKYEGPIKALIGRTLDPVRFSQLAVSAIKSNPALAGCSPSSFMNSVLLAMQMGVEIRRDSAYLIPFGKQCQLLLDYKAKISLARRGGKVGGIQAVSVRANKHKKLNVGSGTAGKTAVLGIRQRGGDTRAMVIADRTVHTIQQQIHKHVEVGSTIYTDEGVAYRDLNGLFFRADSVTHSAGEYARGPVNTNSIESVWAVLKRGVYGVYHQVSAKHLERYVNEFAFRLNQGNVARHSVERLNSFVDAVAGKRITLKQVTA